MEELPIRIIYTINRILSNPRVLLLVCNRMGGLEIVHPDQLREFFYSLMEMDMHTREMYYFEEYDEVIFDFYEESDTIKIMFTTGSFMEAKVVLEDPESSEKTWVKSEEDLVTSMEISGTLMSQIREVLPEEMKHDFILTSLPSPKNNYLMDDKGNYFEGDFNLISDPSKEYHFTASLDISTNQWETNYEPKEGTERKEFGEGDQQVSS